MNRPTFVPFRCSWAPVNKLQANLKQDSNKYITILTFHT